MPPRILRLWPSPRLTRVVRRRSASSIGSHSVYPELDQGCGDHELQEAPTTERSRGLQAVQALEGEWVPNRKRRWGRRLPTTVAGRLVMKRSVPMKRARNQAWRAGPKFTYRPPTLSASAI